MIWRLQLLYIRPVWVCSNSANFWSEIGLAARLFIGIIQYACFLINDRFLYLLFLFVLFCFIVLLLLLFFTLLLLNSHFILRLALKSWLEPVNTCRFASNVYFIFFLHIFMSDYYSSGFFFHSKNFFCQNQFWLIMPFDDEYLIHILFDIQKREKTTKINIKMVTKKNKWK